VPDHDERCLAEARGCGGDHLTPSRSRVQGGGIRRSADAVSIMRSLKWIGLGAALMYSLDPDRGPSRRVRLRDRIIHLKNEMDHAIEVASHDVVDRTRGLVARGRSFLSGEHPPDAVIVARVRSNPGRVTLSGPVPATEVDRLLVATGAPAYDVAIPFHRPQHEKPEIVL
jgi:hypothetical protein